MKNDTIDEIMDDWSIFGYKSHSYPNVAGFWLEEGRNLVELALSAPSGDWAECGSHHGASACLLATAIRNQKLNNRFWAFDIKISPEFKTNVFKKGKFDDIVEPHQGNSANLKDFFEHWDGIIQLGDMPQFSFVFLDGWHSFKAVVTEFEAFLPYLVDNAVIALHDCQPREGVILQDVTYRAKAHYDSYMNSDMPDVDSSNLEKYHAAEAAQDFLILEAACYLADKYGLEFIPTPDEYKCDYSHVTGGYKHGGTSPYNSICALRYKV